MVNISFRNAKEQDLPSLVALVNSAYRGESSRAGWTTEADLLGGQRTDLEDLREHIEKPGGRILMAEGEKGALQGCAYLEVCGKSGQSLYQSLYVGMITVSPTLQGKGLGRAILEEAQRLGKELGCQVLRMTVISVRSELIAWYERRGFARTGETQRFPYGHPRFGLPKVQNLEFVVLEKKLRNPSI